jgi:NAD+ synthase (glutamine-hydrolysing)
MKIGIAQINTTVGDLAGNAEKVINAYKFLCENGAELVVFPELVVTGYPPRDLLYKRHFIENNKKYLNKIVEVVGKVPALIGYVQETEKENSHRFYNAMAWCENGKIEQVSHKCLLPSYEVFDEHRYFEEGEEPLIIEKMGVKIGVTICEDIWTGKHLKSPRKDALDPIQFICEKEVDIIVNLSASPWHFTKHKEREELVKSIARKCNSCVVYCNQVGGNDELIFDGRSFVVSEAGQIIATLKGFREELKVVDIKEKSPIGAEMNEIEEIYEGLVLGLRDYVNKVGFEKAVIGLSGGIDSAVTAAIAVDALGYENVIGVAMPSKVSSDHSVNDAMQLAKNLGIQAKLIPIKEIVSAKEIALNEFLEGTEPDTTEENLQARARGSLLMGIANKTKSLVLSTGNKSEVSVGYCTLYGDMVGGVGVLSDVFKTKVYELADHINKEKELIPKNTITKPPSAELRLDQKDQDTLPPYEILDEILCLYIEKNESPENIIQKGFSESIVNDVIRRVDFK